MIALKSFVENVEETLVVLFCFVRRRTKHLVVPYVLPNETIAGGIERELLTYTTGFV